MQAADLIKELIAITIENRTVVTAFKTQPTDILNHKASPESWSILECIEHLNRYGNFYIPEIRSRLEKSTFTASKTFQPGLLGNYFAKSMLPKEQLNKMKTFESMNPSHCTLDSSVLDLFIKQQDELLALLKRAESADLTKIKTAISISKWIKIRLGDTFRVVIYHNVRHIAQAKRILDLF